MKKYEDAAPTTVRFNRAKQAWIIISGIVVHKLDLDGLGTGIITYGSLNDLMHREEYAAYTQVGYELGMIASVCAAWNLPMLNSVVVSAKTGEPSNSDVTTSAGRENFGDEQREVLKIDWLGIHPPSAGKIRKCYEGN